MTDPAPGADDNDSHHESQDIAAATDTTSAPTASSPAEATAELPNPGEGGQSRDGAESRKTTTGDDGESEEDGSEEEEDEDEEESGESEEEDDEEDEDEEPRLKYARLTQHLSGVYKNADATSSFLVAGDKMVIGTHNGNIVGAQRSMHRPLVPR